MNNFLNLLNYYPGFFNKLSNFIRWLICPFNEMESYLPSKGVIVDIGCGEGLFSIFLKTKSKARIIYGIDLNKKKINLARWAARNIPNLKFQVQDALTFDKKVNGIIMSDVFHHFPKEQQIKILNKMKYLLKKQGILVIKEINKDDFIRSRLSRLWDFILYPKEKINYWSREKLTDKLHKLGFKIVIKKASLLFPGSTILYICLKK